MDFVIIKSPKNYELKITNYEWALKNLESCSLGHRNLRLLRFGDWSREGITSWES